jgi:GNAT superfamily N-acetyltransferase
MIVITSTTADRAEALEELQRIIFPTLSADERLGAEQYRRHLEVFPEGQFVLLDGERIIGATTTMRTTGEEGLQPHQFIDMAGGGWLSRHRPAGEWLYGLDMGIHPEYRGRGLSRLLYRARQDLVARLGLLGQLTVGMMNGYGAVAGQMSGEEYYRQWVEGDRTDPTLTPQRRIGFRPLALIRGYLHDPGCGNYGVLLQLDAGQRV